MVDGELLRGEEGPATGAIRILAVDDELAVRQMLERSLRANGFSVQTAEHGDHALAILERHSFDMAILDYEMPGMDGVELARRIWKKYELPFVMLSVHSAVHIVDDAISAGALNYMVKPMEAFQIIPNVRAALARGQELGYYRSMKERLHKQASGEPSKQPDSAIETAVGILMVQHGLDDRRARLELRRRARKHRRSVQSEARRMADQQIPA